MHRTDEKTRILNELKAEHAALEAMLSQMSEKQMVEILVQDEWTTKDITAHITAWERELLRWLGMAAAGVSPDLPLPGTWSDYVEAFNDQVYARHREDPLAQVLENWGSTFQKLNTTLEALPEDPNDPLWAVWLDGKPPWGLIATFPEHYHFHCWLLQEFLDKRA